MKKIIYAFLMTFCLLPLNVVKACDKSDNFCGWSGNENQPSDKTYHLCPTCENKIKNTDDTYTKLVVAGEDSDGNVSVVELIVCNQAQYSRHGSVCDIVEDSIPNPVNDDLSTNKNYKDAVNNYLDSTIKDGDFTNSTISDAIAKVYCGIDSMNDECAEQVKQKVADNKKIGLGDPFDVNMYPGVKINGDINQMIDSYNYDLCARTTPGVNDFLCRNLNGACLSNSATSYVGVNGNLTANSGTIGVCTYNTTNKIVNVKTCDDYCTVNADLENCHSCCSVGNGTPYYDTSKPGCYSEPDEPPISPEPSDSDECTYRETICDANPSACTSKEDVLPSSIENGGSCDDDYYLDKYEFTGSYADSCGYVPIIKHTTVEISYPKSLNTLVLAGQGFNWYGGFSGTAVVTVYSGETNGLEAAININISRQMEFEDLRDCTIKKTISDAWNSYNEDEEECNLKDDNDSERDKCEANCNGDSECEKPCANLDTTTSQDKCLNNLEEPDEQEIAAGITQGYQQYIDVLEANKKKLERCMDEAANYKGSTTSYPAATTYDNYLNLGKSYSQKENSVKYVDKNNGLPLSGYSNHSIINNYSFFVPSNIQDGTMGNLIATGYSSYAGSLKALCPIKVTNTLIQNGEYNLIYRPIALDNPFPDMSDGETYRIRLGGWSENAPDIFIKNNRDVNDYEVYELTPMYSITLTPSDIKKIRNYNKDTSFNDFNLECTNGLYCKSQFLWNSEFSYIVDTNNSCAMSADWYACDSEKMGNTRDSMLDKLKSK